MRRRLLAQATCTVRGGRGGRGVAGAKRRDAESSSIIKRR